MLSRKHHYIPVFYLKQWCGEDRKLCEYSQPYKVIRCYRRYPSETAFELHLNTMDALAPDVQDIVERKLMAGIDNISALALPLLLQQKIDKLTPEHRTSWAVFVMSAARRNPESMARLREKLIAHMASHGIDLDPRAGEKPETTAARRVFFQSQYAMLFQELITSERVGTHLINMRWSVARFANAKHTLLTSDRPFVMTNGLDRTNSHIAVPLSPTHCFIAANSIEEERRLHSMPPKEFITHVNDRMACQARRFVYGVDDSQFRFVAKRFGRREPSMPGES
jgi:hypothetical protein